MRCLDDRKLRDYLNGSLPAELIIPASEHVRSCDGCGAKLVELAEFARAASSLGAISTASEECPEYETLSAFVEQQLVGSSFAEIEHHILHCELCWQDVETLQAARSRASLAPEISLFPGSFNRRRTWTVLGWKSAGATALGAAAVAVVLMLSHPAVVKNPGSHPTTVASNKGVENRLPGAVAHTPNLIKRPVTEPRYIIRPSGNERPAAPEHVQPNSAAPAPEPEQIALNDGAVTVYSQGGKMSARAGGSDLEAVVASAVNEKLKTSKVSAPFQMASAGGIVRTTNSTSIQISNMTPEPRSLVAQPAFKWDEVSGAESYRIDISKADGTSVVSQETTQPQFEPTEGLAPGFYKWHVAVRKSALAEWSWSDSQMLRVLSDSENDMLTAAKRDYSDSHLVMGTVYQKLGMKAEATQEFRALVQENPGSALAKKLLAGVE